MNPVSKTAWYTLALRARDAERSRPVVGDTFAALQMTDEAREIWPRFEGFTRANAAILARHRIIDDALRAELERDPSTQIVSIGAGFETRALRLEGGSWVEVDEPAIVLSKEAVLPRPARNPLHRVPIDFATGSLTEKLAPFTSAARTVVVVEGVLAYLTGAERDQLFSDLETLFPTHTLYCDLSNRAFVESYGVKLYRALATLVPQPYRDALDAPESQLLARGYRAEMSTSVALRAAELGGFGVPPFVVRIFLATLRDGYRVWRFAREA